LQIVIGRWLKQFGASGTGQPLVKILWLQKDRHPVMHLGRKLIRVSVIIIVQDFNGPPVSMSFHSSHSQAIVSGGPSRAE
jgi:hypothetical protein